MPSRSALRTRNAIRSLPYFFMSELCATANPLFCNDQSQARPLGCSNGPPSRWQPTNLLNPAFFTSLYRCRVRAVVQPPVVGSSTLQGSGLNPPSELRGAGAATFDVASTKPPVSPVPPIRASALSADSFCFFIAERLVCCALTSAS